VQIIQNQNIYMRDIISYTADIKKTEIINLIRYVSQNIKALDLRIGNKIIYTIKSYNQNSGKHNVEVLIPVRGKVSKSEGFEYKKVFKLVNAVTVRHEGSIDSIDTTEKCLEEYIASNNCQPLTKPYYRVIRESGSSSVDSIIDIYIGVDYNEL